MVSYGFFLGIISLPKSLIIWNLVIFCKTLVSFCISICTQTIVGILVVRVLVGFPF